MNLSDNNGKSGKNKKVLLISIGAALLVFLCGCLISILVLSNDSSFGMDELVKFNNDTNLIFIFGLILIASLFLMIFPIMLIMIVRWRNAKTMDGIFEPLGLTGSPYILTGRQYHGVYRGRKIDIYILRGPTVEIHMHGDIRTHFMAVQPGKVHHAVLSNFREEPIRIKNSKLADVVFYGPDKVWIEKLFLDDNAANSLNQLLTQGIDWAVIRRVEVKPGEACLTIYRSKKLMFNLELSNNDLNGVLNSLLNLSKSIELSPDPAMIEEIIEHSTGNSGTRIRPIAIAIIIVILVGLPTCLITVGFLLTLLLSGSL